MGGSSLPLGFRRELEAWVKILYSMRSPNESSLGRDIDRRNLRVLLYLGNQLGAYYQAQAEVLHPSRVIQRAASTLPTVVQ